MATQNGKLCYHVNNFFLNLMSMCFLADPNAAEVIFIKSLINMTSVLPHNVVSLNEMNL